MAADGLRRRRAAAGAAPSQTAHRARAGVVDASSASARPATDRAPVCSACANASQLVAKTAERQSRIELRVVELPRLQLPVLVMLDQMVVRVARKGQRVEPQRIDHRQRQEPQPRLGRGQVRGVEGDEVVPEQKAAPSASGSSFARAARGPPGGNRTRPRCRRVRRRSGGSAGPDRPQGRSKDSAAQTQGVGIWLAVAPGIDRWAES